MGDDVVLQCGGVGTPPPEVNWRRVCTRLVYTIWFGKNLECYNGIIDKQFAVYWLIIL